MVPDNSDSDAVAVPALPQHRDIVIIGAGPAGTAAAIELARAEIDAIVIDKATFPREKCCGDGLTTSALRQLEALGLDPSTLPSWCAVHDIRIVSPSGRSVLLPLPRDRGRYAAAVRRSELDHALVQQARRTGAEIIEGVAVNDIDARPDGATITTSAGTITAQAVIAADGMWSPTRRALGLTPPDYRGEWHAFRQYMSNVSEQAATELIVWFEPDVLPGYVWSFPIGGGVANVGYGIQRGRSHRIKDMGKLWADLQQRPQFRAALGPDATPEGPHKAWPIPARLGEIALHHQCVSLVGDAAAATDPMTGEGIGQALETGRLAAQCIAAFGLDNFDAAMTRYHDTLRSGMIRDHRLANALIPILASRRGARGALAIVDLNSWTRRHFARWLFEDYPRAAAFNPARWERGIFNQPGAYSSTDYAEVSNAAPPVGAEPPH